MTAERAKCGRIMIAPRAIATIASQTALGSYGVVGMASKNLVNGIARALALDPSHGVTVHTKDGEISIDIYVMIEYGTRISSVTNSVANNVRYQVEKAIGMPVSRINVHVQDLRISNTD
ncbi:MAG: Asp23/Gls24 family envelope stress response protein [Anaerolineales bacterium]|nr:Asp23/Gls24 family envelope stress response protein [Anaerolineales bacterium]